MKCPSCDIDIDDEWAQKRHMEINHPEVIEDRMVEAGFRRDHNGHWVDEWASD